VIRAPYAGHSQNTDHRARGMIQIIQPSPSEGRLLCPKLTSWIFVNLPRTASVLQDKSSSSHQSTRARLLTGLSSVCHSRDVCHCRDHDSSGPHAGRHTDRHDAFLSLSLSLSLSLFLFPFLFLFLFLFLSTVYPLRTRRRVVTSSEAATPPSVILLPATTRHVVGQVLALAIVPRLVTQCHSHAACFRPE